MSSYPKIKICGLTQYKDLVLADKLGADYFGFILYEPSPRHLSFEKLSEMIVDLPLERCVFVDVMPSECKLHRYQSLGCKTFQIHTRSEAHESGDYFKQLNTTLTREALWLAPQIPNLMNMEASYLDYSDTFLIDTYSESQIGGTGKVGDWSGFSKLKKSHSNKTWILAGGLHPGNVLKAVRETKADCIDVNSGVESSPGIKDADTLMQLFEALKTLHK